MAPPPVATEYWAVEPTVMDGLMLAILLASVGSLAVIVWVPAAPKVKLKSWEPETSAVFGGSVAMLSLEVIATVSPAELIRFQLASTALTVTLKAAARFWLNGVPVLPVALPGAGVSPVTNNCSLAKTPAFTVTSGLVLAVMLACVASEAVTVAVPAVLSVTLKLLLPLTNAALAGNAAFASLEAIATVSLVLTTFPVASTQLTVAVKAVPAVWAKSVPVLPLAVPGAALSPGSSS